MRGFAAIGLHAPKSECNVGGALRAAACYGAQLAAIQGSRTVRYPTDTHRAWRHMPVLLTGDLLSVVPYDCVPVGIEFLDDARNLVDYTHPERAYYLFGPEDGSLPKRVLERCRDVVRVPTRLCMNLAATVNVVLYDRLAKRGQP